MKQISQLFDTRFITWVVLAFVFLFFVYYPAYLTSFIIFVLLEILIFEWPKFFSIYDPTFWVITPFYPVLPFLLILKLNAEPYRMLLFISFILSFAFDTGAYVTGSLFGKNKIVPNISPKKTYEGTIGGYLFTLLTLNAILLFLGKSFSFFTIWFSLIISFLAFFGDLFESYLKRKANIKDSGSLLPGQGGFLDRFDSILTIVTFCYIFKNFLILYFI